MTRLTLVRYAVLAGPILLLGLAQFRRLTRRRAGALLLAFLATLVGLAALDRTARALGWWQFEPVRGAFGGLPVDAWLGWAVLWGPLPVALGWSLPRWRVALPLAAVAWVDLLTMPRLTPLVRLGPGWWAGELAGLALVAVPAVLLGEWTSSTRRLPWRVAGQVVLFAGLVGWLLPTTAMELGDGSWTNVLAAPRWQLSLLAQGFLLVAAPGLAALVEFAGRGGGTPYPWDPPVRLVTTGPYAYLANPMQVSAAGLLLLVAAATRSWSVLAAAALTFAFSEAVAEKHERDDLRRRHGSAWLAYRRQVRRWLPRWRPAAADDATLYLDLGCDPCRELEGAFRRLGPVRLTLADARDHPGQLTRVRYERADGLVADGTAAVAYAAEHVHAGYAVLGWVARLPGVSWVVGRVADLAGLGPRPAGGGRTLPSGRERAETETRWRRTPGGG